MRIVILLSLFLIISIAKTSCWSYEDYANNFDFSEESSEEVDFSEGSSGEGDDTEVVGTYSKYCDLTRRGGPRCDLKGEDKTLVIPDGFSRLNVLELELHNAKNVILNPVCLPWVQVWNLGGLSTPQDSKSDCRTWLRAYNSHIDTLSKGILDVSLINSTVSSINLANIRDFMSLHSNITLIEHLDWEDYAGLIGYSNIHEIVSFRCRDDLEITSSGFGVINHKGFTFSGVNLVITNSTFEILHDNAIEIKTGNATITNTVFTQLLNQSIVVRPGAHLRLENVTIHNCVAPCVVVPYDAALWLRNVTVAGVALTELRGSVLVTEADEAHSSAKALLEYEQCSVREESIECNFEGYHESVYLLPRANEEPEKVTVRNCEALHVVNACNLDLTIFHSKAWYTTPGAGNDTSVDCEGNEGLLEAFNSTFKFIEAKNLVSLKLINSSSEDIRINNLNRMEVSRGSIVERFSGKVSDESIINSSSIYFNDAALRGGLQAENSSIKTMGHIEIGSEGTKSKIYNSYVNMLHTGIKLSGFMNVSTVLFGLFNRAPINMTEDALLHLHKIPNHPTIRVHEKNQVQFSGGSLPYDHLIVYHPGASDVNFTSVAGAGQPDCQVKHGFIANSYYICDYTGQNEGKGERVVIRGGLGHGDRLLVKGGASVTVQEACRGHIIVSGAKSLTMEKYVSSRTCRGYLNIEDSKVDSIFGTFSDVKILNSTVDSIRTDNVNSATRIYQSKVGQIVNHKTRSLRIAESVITQMNGVTTQYNSEISHSTINEISKVRLRTSTTLVMRETTVGQINEAGISIEKNLKMINVAIDNLLPKSIKLSSARARLHLTNVTVHEGDASAFVLYGVEGHKFEGVTIRGLRLEYDDTSRVRIVQVTTTEDPVPPEQKEEIVQAATEDSSKNSPANLPGTTTSSFRSGEHKGEQDQEKNSSATVGIVSMVVVVSMILALLSMGILVRSKRRGETFSDGMRRLFYRPRGEDLTTLTTGMDMDSSTLYSRVPAL